MKSFSKHVHLEPTDSNFNILKKTRSIRFSVLCGKQLRNGSNICRSMAIRYPFSSPPPKEGWEGGWEGNFRLPFLIRAARSACSNFTRLNRSGRYIERFVSFLSLTWNKTGSLRHRSRAVSRKRLVNKPTIDPVARRGAGIKWRGT